MTLQGEIGARVCASIAEHLEEGRKIMVDIGEDGRPPLTRVQRWRFTAQTLLRRGLVDGHPAMTAFNQHCYRGLLDPQRFERALALFENCAVAVNEHGVAFRSGFVLELLNSVVLASEEVPDTVLQGTFWSALSTLASLAGVRGPGEYPAPDVLCARLTSAGLLCGQTAVLLTSTHPTHVREAAAKLLERLDSASSANFCAAERSGGALSDSLGNRS
jgi:hypothetical protein